MQDYAKRRDVPTPPYSKLACKLAPDGNALVAGSVKVYPPSGYTEYVAAVGTPEQFNAQTAEKPPRDLSILKRIWDGAVGANRHSVSDKDIDGSDTYKKSLANAAKDALKKCAKQFPST